MKRSHLVAAGRPTRRRMLVLGGVLAALGNPAFAGAGSAHKVALGGPRPPYAPIGPEPLPKERAVVPMVFPVIGPVRWRNSYDDNRGSYRHTGVDIAAPKLAPIVAAIAGVLGMKQFSFWIVGQGAWSGWTVLGTHLNDDTPGTNDGCGGRDWMFAPNLRGGDHVAAGQLIGFVGDSGNATGSHLHFELYGPRGVVSPVASLHMAQRLSRPRAVLERPEERPDEGMLRVDGAPRGFDGHSRLLTVAVVARQASDGHAAVPSRPMRFQVRLSESQVAALGGEAGIAALPRDRALRIFIRDAAPSSAVKVAASANTAPVLVAQAR